MGVVEDWVFRKRAVFYAGWSSRFIRKTLQHTRFIVTF